MYSFRLYAKSYKFIRYAATTEGLISNLPLSLGEMEFEDYSLFSEVEFDIKSDNSLVIIILKDDELYDKNLLYLFNKIFEYNKSFETFTLNEGNYCIIRLNNDYVTNYFISIESNKPSLKIIEDIDSFESDKPSTQILNQKIVYAYNEAEVIIKTRFYD